MMTNRCFVLIFTVLVTFLSCSDDDGPNPNPPSDSINKIMPLGASRVEGARPDFESYRYELWKLMIDGGWTFDFVGTMSDPAAYANYSAQAFDADHEGRGGWTSGQILGGINEWLEATGAPDIVLFSSPGGNDALTGLPYADAVSNVNAIIDAIQAANPNVTIIIEQLAPARSDLMTTTLTDYFTRIKQDVVDIANQQSTATSSVLTVDMATGFSDSFLADDVHYNETGASFIANQYYDVLVNVLQQ